MLIDGSEGTWKQLRRGGRRAAKCQRAWLGGAWKGNVMLCLWDIVCGRVLVDMGTGLDWLERMNSLGDNQIMAKVSCQTDTLILSSIVT